MPLAEIPNQVATDWQDKNVFYVFPVLILSNHSMVL